MGGGGVIQFNFSEVGKTALYYNTFITINEIIKKSIWCYTIFLKLTKYAYFDNHAINIIIIFIS